MNSLPHIYQILGAIAGIIALSAARWRAVRDWHRARVASRDVQAKAIADERRAVVHERDTLARILHEVLPNTGDSLRDAVTRTENQVKLIRDRQAVVEHQLNDVIDASPTATFMLHADGTVKSVSAELHRAAGITVDAIRSGRWREAIHPDDRDRIKRSWQSSLERSEGFLEQYRASHLVDGRKLLVEAKCMPIREASQMLGWSGQMKFLVPPEKQ